MANLTISSSSGYLLEEPLVFENCPVDEYLDDKHWLLTRAQAESVIQAWRDVQQDPRFPWVRAYRYHPVGLFTTAEYFEGELALEEWESAYGADDFDLYSTSQLPFHLEVAAAIA